MNELSEQDIEKYRLQLRKLSNSGQYGKAYKVAKNLHQKHPSIFIFAYYEAVMTAEDEASFTSKQVDQRFKLAAKKLKKLISKFRKINPAYKRALRNEYFWFSKQPYKQYRLGISEQKKSYPNAKRSGYYSQGVGAAQLAKQFALQNKKSIAVRWAKKSEQAWIKFHKIDPTWANSYSFYAMSLAFQNRLKDFEMAMTKWHKYANKPKTWNAVQKHRKDVMQVHGILYNNS